MTNDTANHDLIVRRLNNAAVHLSHGEFESAFQIYEQTTGEFPESAEAWQGWLQCCFQWIEAKHCVFCMKDLKSMKTAYEKACELASPAEAQALEQQWDAFWRRVGDGAWSGEFSFFHEPKSKYAVEEAFSLFQQEFVALSDIHPCMKQLIQEGCQNAMLLTGGGVCFAQVEKAPAPGKRRLSTDYDWLPLTSEMNTHIEFLLGNMCLMYCGGPAMDGVVPEDARGILIFLQRPINMDTSPLKDFQRYSKWRWNSLKVCPYCGRRLTGLFSRACTGCGRDVAKIKVK